MQGVPPIASTTPRCYSQAVSRRRQPKGTSFGGRFVPSAHPGEVTPSMPMRLDADNSPERDFWDDLAEMAHVCEFKRVWDGVLHERINGCYEFKCQCGKSEFRQAVAREIHQEQEEITWGPPMTEERLKGSEKVPPLVYPHTKAARDPSPS